MKSEPRHNIIYYNKIEKVVNNLLISYINYDILKG